MKNSKRVALCLYGLVGGKVDKGGGGGDLDYNIAFNSYQKHILSKNKIDIFIHSWSIDHKEGLIKLYKPKDSIIEPQIDFKNEINLRFKEYYVDFTIRIKNMIKNVFRSKKVIFYSQRDRAFRARSRWYSNKRVIELKKNYELENNFEYDFVMVSRLDVCFFSDILFSSFDNSYFYASNWNDVNIQPDGSYMPNKQNNQEGRGFMDLWFFSNSKLMDKFGSLYDNISNYDISPHRSSFQHVAQITKRVKFKFYRWNDYELVRRKIFKSLR